MTRPDSHTHAFAHLPWHRKLHILWLFLTGRI